MLIFLKIVNIEFKNKFNMLFFQKMFKLPSKQDFITFTLLIQIEWIKAFHVDI